MMPSFSAISESRLATCHPNLQLVFNELITRFDHSILCGHRGMAAQNAAYHAVPQLSKVMWPAGKHNQTPSLAVDAAPYPVVWLDTRRMAYFAGMVVELGHAMKIPIRWGGDWDRDTDLADQKFNDLVHFELVEGF
tara:strand:+ start:67 stop:474 length:408 start_codon:yes stop_codon:yes gene_type:complete